MAQVIRPISNKIAGVAHSAVDRAQKNRTLTVVSLGLLALGAGTGIWALIKKYAALAPDDADFSAPSIARVRTARSSIKDSDPDFENDDFRRSSQY